ncbi:MAG: hypothetical protein AAGA70_14505 [Pseudomonadota bacterium]
MRGEKGLDEVSIVLIVIAIALLMASVMSIVKNQAGRGWPEGAFAIESVERPNLAVPTWFGQNVRINQLPQMN